MHGENAFVPSLEKITTNKKRNNNDVFDLDNGNSEAAAGRGCINCTFAARFNECKEKEKENPSNPRLKDDLFIFF